MSTGRINLHVMGLIGDVDVKYDYSYFTKFVKRNAHFAKEYRNLHSKGDFGGMCEFRIPMNAGDLLKSVCLEVKTTQLTDADHYYIDSFGNALVEYAELIIGGKVINRLTSDYLQLYTETFYEDTKKSAFKNLINRTDASLLDQPFNGINNKQLTNNQLHCIIDLPFYFHKHPELAIPLCAIKLQDVTIRIKLRDYKELVYEKTTSQTPNDTTGLAMVSTALPPTITQAPKITKCELITELVYLDVTERKKLECKKTDYVITELQEEEFKTLDERTNSIKCKLNFSNPVKELYFFIQRDRQAHQDIGVFTSPLNYDPIRWIDFDQDASVFTVTPDQLKYLTLELDGLKIVDDNVGTPQFMRISQFMRHHSNVPKLSRVYMYSFALDPESWYPTGQVNFSLIKEQILKFELWKSATDVNSASYYFSRYVRIYAKSYNILRVKDGEAHTLF
jgi:hypothetical protein